MVTGPVDRRNKHNWQGGHYCMEKKDKDKWFLLRFITANVL